MATYDERTASLDVYTFKEGMLSALAHDLKLTVQRFHVESTDQLVEATIDARSLKAVTSIIDGEERPAVLGALALKQIEQNTANDVLHTSQHPEIRFRGKVDGTKVEGQLTLHGRTRDVVGQRSGQSVEWSLDQRDFGIRPYSAALGTLKVKPVVRIVFRVKPAP